MKTVNKFCLKCGCAIAVDETISNNRVTDFCANCYCVELLRDEVVEDYSL